MSQTFQVAEVNSLAGGFISDTNILNPAPATSRLEYNFEIQRNGDRARRLGVMFESGYTLNTLPYEEGDAFNSFTWNGASSNANKKFMVVQVGASINIHTLAQRPYSAAPIASFGPWGNPKQKFVFSEIDGMLVVVTGDPQVRLVTYDVPTETFKVEEQRILVRDFFGVDDIFEGNDLFSGNNVKIRPAELTQEHTYNLRNQSWSDKRLGGNSESAIDPIAYYYNVAAVETSIPGGHLRPPTPGVGLYPSNADSVTFSLYADPGDADDRTIERFFPRDLLYNSYSTERSPSGHFLIDLLERGKSRLEMIKKTEEYNAYTKFLVGDLPEDTTSGGIGCLASFAGRVFYSDFRGETIDGMKSSPTLNSYVAFSQVVRGPQDICACYQSGDPTSKENPDLVETDGGFLRIDGALDIKSMKVISNNLIIIASNGVWALSGGNNEGFKATNYMLTRLSDRGCVAPMSVVVIDNTVMFFGQDGIYQVGFNQLGDLSCDNITKNKISKWYDELVADIKNNSFGVYDSLSKTVRWVMNSSIERVGNVEELVYHLPIGSFTLNRISEAPFRTLGCPVKTEIIEQFVDSSFVNVGADKVVVGTSDVVIKERSLRDGAREIIYLAFIRNASDISYTVAGYDNQNFIDWNDEIFPGVDAPAYLEIHPITGGDAQRRKQVAWFTTHFRKTEVAVVPNPPNGLGLKNASSCFMRTMWNFSTLALTGKWSTLFQAYKPRRPFFTKGVTANLDTGYEIVRSKHRLRGTGVSFAFSMETEPNKDCVLIGWSLVLGINNNV